MHVTTRHVGLVLAVSVILSLLAAGLPTAVSGRTVSVVSLANDGPGTLRAALAEASDGDRIEFGVVGTIALSSTLAVDRSVTVQGPEYPVGGEPVVRVSGGGQVPVLLIAAPGVSLENLAVVNGVGQDRGSGGGITNQGGLTIRRCLVAGNMSDNNGGGILNTGSLAVSESRVVRNSAGSSGGGVYSGGTDAVAVVEASRIVSNTAGSGDGYSGSGGGYYGPGPISETVFEENVADTDGGGLYLTGGLVSRCSVLGNRANRGAGVFVAGQSTIANTTIIENAARLGGGLYNAARLMLFNATVVGNSAAAGSGGGIAGGANTSNGGSWGRYAIYVEPMLVNTIVSENADGNCACPIADAGSNIQHPGTDCGETMPSVDPILGDLDRTDSSPGVMPESGSPAIDGGNPGTCALEPVLGVDQRGMARPTGGDRKCDIGALEFDSPFTPTPGYSPAATGTPLPADLVPYNLWPEYSYHCWRPGEHYDLLATIQNVGASAAGPFTVALDDARLRWSGTLTPGGKGAVLFDFKNCGPCTLAVDVDGDVPEIFKGNNAGVFYGVTMTPPPPCMPAVYVPYSVR